MEPEDNTPLYSPEEEALIQRVKESSLWQALRRSMVDERESLLSTPTPTTELVLQAWGAAQQITRWLNSGPQLVVYSDRLRRQENPNGR